MIRGHRFVPEPTGSTGICEICGEWRLIRHKDHIIPRWAGGGEELENLQMICGVCHDEKTAYEAQNRAVWNDPEWRAKVSAGTKAAATPEVRAKISAASKLRKGINNRKNSPATAEELAKRSESMRAAHAKKTPEERSAIASKRWEGISAEERSEVMKKVNAAQTPEQRSEAKRKAWETRRASSNL